MNGDDQPDELWVGPVGPIPINYEDDPRLEGERIAWREAAAVADLLLTPDELLEGLRHQDWHVRFWVVDRLKARAGADPRLTPALIERLREDSAFEVRERVAISLMSFPGDERVTTALKKAIDDDASEDVRRAAEIALVNVGRS